MTFSDGVLEQKRKQRLGLEFSSFFSLSWLEQASAAACICPTLPPLSAMLSPCRARRRRRGAQHSQSHNPRAKVLISSPNRNITNSKKGYKTQSLAWYILLSGSLLTQFSSVRQRGIVRAAPGVLNCVFIKVPNCNICIYCHHNCLLKGLFLAENVGVSICLLSKCFLGT